MGGLSRPACPVYNSPVKKISVFKALRPRRLEADQLAGASVTQRKAGSVWCTETSGFPQQFTVRPFCTRSWEAISLSGSWHKALYLSSEFSPQLLS